MTSPYSEARIPCKRHIYELNDADDSAKLTARSVEHERNNFGAESPPKNAIVQVQEDTDLCETPSKKARYMHGRHVKEDRRRRKDPLKPMEAPWKAECVAYGMNKHGTCR